MRTPLRPVFAAAAIVAAISTAWACGHDESLRHYLSVTFWLPWAKHPREFAQKTRRTASPYAGMQRDESGTPLARLREVYQKVFSGVNPVPANAPEWNEWKAIVAAARAGGKLSAREREEIDLIEAKMGMRESADDPASWEAAKRRFQTFLQRSRVPAFASEARGWLALTHYRLGEQSAAGKIYLDELNRPGSNLSAETMATSLRMNYGYNGGEKLRAQLEDYFDTAEHAAFAIHMLTNPLWSGNEDWSTRGLDNPPPDPVPYARIRGLLEKHRELFQTEKGAAVLATLAIRTALRAGDPASALRMARDVPAGASVRAEPEFLWMLASAEFLSCELEAAEKTLITLFESKGATRRHRAAAAYGLCGIYRKQGNAVQQLRFALWLRANIRPDDGDSLGGARLRDMSVYWAISGWDLGMILEIEAPVTALREFLQQYPQAGEIRQVKYALAVRLAREGQPEESARWYMQAGAPQRAARMNELARLINATKAPAANPQQILQAKFQLASYIAANQERLFFNDRLWSGFQRGALFAAEEWRFTAAEREQAIAQERELKDAQEEYWQAYRILREVTDASGPNTLGRQAAQLGLTCLQRIAVDRFGREKDIANAGRELATSLRGAAKK